MTLLVLALMAYSVTGQEVHEWMGVGMFLLFLLHHGLNAAWFRSLTKGRYTPLRVLQAALVLLLLVSVAAQIVSGLAMARYALPFLNIPIPTSTARLLHLACGYWSFLLMGLHLGLHWSIFLGLGRELRGGRPLPAPGCARRGWKENGGPYSTGYMKSERAGPHSQGNRPVYFFWHAD